MKPPSFCGGRLAIFLVVGALATGLGPQAGASPAPSARAVEKPAVQQPGEMKAEKPPDGDGAKAAIPPALEIEIQRRFNEIEKERLDDRANAIDWWLAVVAIVLTFFGIVVAIAGLVGFRRLREIEAEARGSVGETSKHNAEAKKHSEEAKRLIEEIKKNRDKSQEFLNMTAEKFAEMYKDDPEKARQTAEEVRENPWASLMDKAVAAALSLQEEGRRDESIEKWRGIAQVAEGNDDELATRAWFSIGYLFDKQRKHEEAVAAYDESIRLKPNHANTYNNRGNAKAALGQHEAAIADYDQAIRLNSNFAEAYNNRGVANKDMRDYEAAIGDYDQAIRLKPDYATAYMNRGIAYDASGDKDAARGDFGKARDLAREDGDKEVTTEAERKLKELDDHQGA